MLLLALRLRRAGSGAKLRIRPHSFDPQHLQMKVQRRRPGLYKSSTLAPRGSGGEVVGRHDKVANCFLTGPGDGLGEQFAPEVVRGRSPVLPVAAKQVALQALRGSKGGRIFFF